MGDLVAQALEADCGCPAYFPLVTIQEPNAQCSRGEENSSYLIGVICEKSSQAIPIDSLGPVSFIRTNSEQ
jgi:hypothetical protein